MSDDAERSRRLDELLAKQEIREVLMRFCRGIDRGDVELVRSCYHPDAWDDHGAYRGGVEGLCEAVKALIEHTLVTEHFLGASLIELDGESAESESYIHAHHRLPARDGRPEIDQFVGARYLDVFERRDGSWRIARRTVVHSWNRRLEAAPPWRGAEALVQGVRGPEDLVYRLRDAPRRPPLT